MWCFNAIGCGQVTSIINSLRNWIPTGQPVILTVWGIESLLVQGCSLLYWSITWDLQQVLCCVLFGAEKGEFHELQCKRLSHLTNMKINMFPRREVAHHPVWCLNAICCGQVTSNINSLRNWIPTGQPVILTVWGIEYLLVQGCSLLYWCITWESVQNKCCAASYSGQKKESFMNSSVITSVTSHKYGK